MFLFIQAYRLKCPKAISVTGMGWMDGMEISEHFSDAHRSRGPKYVLSIIFIIQMKM